MSFEDREYTEAQGNMGQRGVLGRYPVHFHLGMAAGRGNSLIGAAIHDNFQRCLTIHYTSNLYPIQMKPNNQL